MQRKIILYLWLLVFLQGGVAQAEQAAVADIRVLVDVSGSMYRNDPDNLRGPALRLLFGLAPEDARVGMWSFARYTNNQLKPAYATSAWKKKARRIADTVHSRGQRTNIEDVLRRSTWDWKRTDKGWSRHLILLTDGVVDVSKDAVKNIASRRRILKEILPQLQQGGVKIHSIALSEQADHELLKELSRETDGWYERVDDSETLQRVFLRMFEKASPGDTVPIRENRFNVDKNVTDMTLIVFRKKGDKKTQIQQPDGTVFSAEQHIDTIEWHAETGYDIITVKKPVTGEWTILADEDPDNRVRILTNLRLATGKLSNNILLGEELTITASLLEQDKPIEDSSILDVVNFSVDISTPANDKNHHYILEKKTTSQYSRTVSDLPDPGLYDIEVIAEASTFVRSKRHSVRVHEIPVEVSITEHKENLDINISAVPDVFRKDSIHLGIMLPGDQGVPRSPDKIGANHWRYSTDRLYPGEHASIVINGMLSEGKAYEHLVPVTLPGEKKIEISEPINLYAVPVTETPVEKHEKQKNKSMSQPEADENAPVNEDKQEQAPDIEGDKKVSWWLVGSILALSNILVIVAAILVYKRWIKDPDDMQVDLEEEEVAQFDTGAVADTEETGGTATSQPEDEQPSGQATGDDSEVSEDVSQALDQLSADEEDFTSQRREDTEPEPIKLDEEDIPEFEIESEEQPAEEKAPDKAEDSQEKNEETAVEASADIQAEAADTESGSGELDDEFARATREQLEGNDNDEQTDIDDVFAQATAEQLESESQEPEKD